MEITTVSIDDIFLPPPSKILRRGTPELEAAMETGAVTFSLPQPELDTWLNGTLAAERASTSSNPSSAPMLGALSSECYESLNYQVNASMLPSLIEL